MPFKLQLPPLLYIRVKKDLRLKQSANKKPWNFDAGITPVK
jgi:hypothetical protein